MNQVDEADLEALMEDGETAEETPAVCNCTEKCAAVIELNHMFLRLCGPPSIPLSFIVADVLPAWDFNKA